MLSAKNHPESHFKEASIEERRKAEQHLKQVMIASTIAFVSGTLNPIAGIMVMAEAGRQAYLFHKHGKQALSVLKKT